MTRIESPVFRSPLNHRESLEGGTLTLKEDTDSARLILRGDFADLKPALEEVELSLPETCKFALHGAARVYWQGPDALFITCSKGGASELKAKLEKSLSGKHAQLVDVSNHFTEVLLEGDNARETLAKLCVVDLHASEFKPGKVVGTNAGSATVLLACEGDNTFRMMVRASFADYLWCDMAHAGREFGLPAQHHGFGEVVRHG